MQIIFLQKIQIFLDGELDFIIQQFDHFAINIKNIKIADELFVLNQTIL